MRGRPGTEKREPEAHLHGEPPREGVSRKEAWRIVREGDARFGQC